jgi:site-specific DNA-methyltransferase (adenine-specific)
LPLNSIICGDNVETLLGFPADSIDLTVTSPPYDNLRTYGGHSWDFEGVAAELWRVTKPGGVVVWVVADATIDGSETGTSFRQALRFMEIGFRLHDTMIWNKGGFSDVGSTQTRYGPVVEFMFVLSKGKPITFNALKDRRNVVPFRKISGTVKDASGVARPQSNIGKALGEFGIRFNDWAVAPDRDSRHPAPFPESLARDHILSWSNEGDIVLDPFSGSGTTAKMAKHNGRKYIGIEVNPEYCEIAEERLRQGVLF